MSKKNETIKDDSLKENKNDRTQKKEPNQAANETGYVPQQQNSQYLVNLLMFIIAVLSGMLIQQYIMSNNKAQEFTTSNSQPPFLNQEIVAPKPKEPLVDMEAIYKEMAERLKKELQDEENRKNSQKESTLRDEKKTRVQDDIINEKQDSKRVVIDDKMVEDDKSGIKIDPNGPAEFESNGIKFKVNTKNEPKEKEAEAERRLKEEEDLKKKEEAARKRKADERERKKKEEEEDRQLKKENEKKAQNNKAAVDNAEDIPDEIKNFPTKKISQIKTKKMWIPIPNSNGGHRRVPPIEINQGKAHGSSVKIWLFEEFLSKEECENLIQAHESHLREMLKQKPIICFDSIATLRKNLIEIKREKVAEIVTPLDFTQGTTCINQTFSRQLEKWGLKWSFSTAFYPGESKFSTIFGKRIEEATMLNETHGGKFQITSYPFEVGYKDHTDCVVDNKDERDRYATFLVYLNDLGADGGGETIFPELGNDIKPREGRALVWNNMDYSTGKCEPKSIHNAAKVLHPVKKKYIIQRWYYYKNFYALGKRSAEVELPERPPNTPKVSCDAYENGSCRMYDEWNPDHLLDYRRGSKLY